MQFFLRYSVLALSGATISGALAGPAAAAWWSPPFGQNAQAASAPGAPLNGGGGPPRFAAYHPRYQDGSYTGSQNDAYYGQVQVQVTVHGGRLVSVDAVRYPADRSTSRSINRQALPMLEREVIQAQSARVDLISGATLTSRAYVKSLGVALRKASAVR